MNRIIPVASVALLLSVAPASGQMRPVELGFDAGLTVVKTDGVATRFFSLPSKWMRVTLPLGSNTAVETLLAWDRVSEGGRVFSALEIRPSLVWLWGEEDGTRPYVRAGGGLSRSSDPSDTEYQFGLGAALGVRIRINDALAARLEAGWDHSFETDGRPSANYLRLSVGLSVAVR